MLRGLWLKIYVLQQGKYLTTSFLVFLFYSGESRVCLGPPWAVLGPWRPVALSKSS